jgi:hypothetical protein
MAGTAQLAADRIGAVDLESPRLPLTTAQIGRSGEILVQYRLLLNGIDSAPMTTDGGIDLVAFGPQRRAVTIQVKANLQPKPAGGKGRLACDWWIPEDSPAELVALVELRNECVWLLKHQELVKIAQQRSSGRLHIYAYADALFDAAGCETPSQLNLYRLERRIDELFGGAGL